MAESNGTSRFRKSKPPKGGKQSNSDQRTTRTRGGPGDTLRSGPAATGAGQPTGTQGLPQPVQGSQAAQPVKTSMPTVIRSGSAPHEADALAQTHHDPRRSERVDTPPKNLKQVSTRAGRTPLASTMRMELTVPPAGSGGLPGIRLNPPAGPASMGPAQTGSEGAALRPDTLQEIPVRTRKATTPGHAPDFLRPYAALDSTAPRGSDLPPDSRPSLEPQARPSLPPRRPRRPGERTMIVQRRPKSSRRDWVFVVSLIGALGLTASMYLSYKNPSRDVVDPAAYEDSQLDEEANPFADTTLQPWTGQPAQPGSAEAAPGVAANVESSVSASSVLATELRSVPDGAQVSVGTAVVGNTPVRVAREANEVEYTLRSPGFAPKSVRVGAQSPGTIIVELLALPSAAPGVPVPAATGDSTGGPGAAAVVTQ